MIHLLTSFFEITLWIDMHEAVHKLQRVFSVMYPHRNLLLLDIFILLKHRIFCLVRKGNKINEAIWYSICTFHVDKIAIADNRHSDEFHIFLQENSKFYYFLFILISFCC